ncbi:MAG: YHS domain-containing protein [Arenicella sp.]|nr:YHS domain-containing protein [Arenicella sp.]
MRRTYHLSLFILMLLGVTKAWAIDPTYTGFFSDKAIKGYDTVAYFVEGRAVKGDERYKTEYQQAVWLFSSRQNLDLFLREPDKYAPQYGGYCAYAIAQNKTASIQPELFTIHQGKLYLNYSPSINQKWLADKDSYIVDADKNWPALLQK